jgi:hypothetical protein
MAISGISGVGGARDVTATRQQLADRAIQKLETSGDGAAARPAPQAAVEKAASSPPPATDRNVPSVEELVTSAGSGGPRIVSREELAATNNPRTSALAVNPPDLNRDGKVTGAERRASEYRQLSENLLKDRQGTSGGTMPGPDPTAPGGVEVVA